MGHCTSDIYKTAKKQYGEVFEKLVVRQESLIKFKEWVGGKQQQYDSKLVSRRTSLNKQVEQIEQSLLNNFSQSKLSLQSQLPYGVSSYEQMKKSSLQNLLGLDGFRNKLNEARNWIDSKCNNNKETFHKLAEQIIKKVEQQSTVDNKKLKLFQDLPQQKKKFIYDKGVKEFEKLISSRSTQLENAHSTDLNPDTHLEKLNSILPSQKLHSLIPQSKAHFKTQTQNITGTNQDSEIRV